MSIEASEFRPLHPVEKITLTNALTKLRKGREGLRALTGSQLTTLLTFDNYNHISNYLSISYQYLPGGFLVCILMCTIPPDHVTRYMWRGVSRRSYKDRPNRIRGEMLAFGRAVFYSYGVEI